MLHACMHACIHACTRRCGCCQQADSQRAAQAHREHRARKARMRVVGQPCRECHRGCNRGQCLLRVGSKPGPLWSLVVVAGSTFKTVQQLNRHSIADHPPASEEVHAIIDPLELEAAQLHHVHPAGVQRRVQLLAVGHLSRAQDLHHHSGRTCHRLPLLSINVRQAGRQAGRQEGDRAFTPAESPHRAVVDDCHAFMCIPVDNPCNAGVQSQTALIVYHGGCVRLLFKVHMKMQPP
jgi:hypothetical protein